MDRLTCQDHCRWSIDDELGDFYCYNRYSEHRGEVVNNCGPCEYFTPRDSEDS